MHFPSRFLLGGCWPRSFRFKRFPNGLFACGLCVVLASLLLGAAHAATTKIVRAVVPRWQMVRAFPKLTFTDPLMLIPVPRSNQLCVISRQGKVEFFVNMPTVAQKTLVLDLTSHCQSWNDCGLLGIAFHPDFGKAGSPNRGYFYVWFNYSDNPTPGPDQAPPYTPSRDRLVRYTIPDGKTTADPASAVVLIDQNDLDLWHNGGGMFFGADGFLYLSLGDEGYTKDYFGNGQRVDKSLFSGVIRIDVDQNPKRSHPIPRQPVDGVTGNYGIPNDNPWVGRPNTLEEFYAIGLRCPHRMTYDAPSNSILCGEVGQSLVESLYLIVKGGNYRWSYMEGNVTGPLPKPATVLGTEKAPIYAYAHLPTEPNSCIIGGYVYHGVAVPQYHNDYIFGDNSGSSVFAMSGWQSANPVVTQIATLPPGSYGYTGLSSFGYDALGNLYVCKLGLTTGAIYRLVPEVPTVKLTRVTTP